MSKPKTKVPAPALALAPGDVTLEPIGAPNVLLSKLRIDRSSGEKAVDFARDQLSVMMKQNEGSVPNSYLATLLDDIARYYATPAPFPHSVGSVDRLTPLADDAVTILDISKSAIKNRAWKECRVFRLDSLFEEAKFNFVRGQRIAELKLKAVNENNQGGIAVLTQTEQYLGLLFGANGVRYKPNSIQQLTLTIPREVVDDRAGQQQIVPFNFNEKFGGFAAFYKSSKKCDRVLIALCRNSMENLVNLQVSFRDQKIAELESRFEALEGRMEELDN